MWVGRRSGRAGKSRRERVNCGPWIWIQSSRDDEVRLACRCIHGCKRVSPAAVRASHLDNTHDYSLTFDHRGCAVEREDFGINTMRLRKRSWHGVTSSR
jgi:hypothetical protein